MTRLAKNPEAETSLHELALNVVGDLVHDSDSALELLLHKIWRMPSGQGITYFFPDENRLDSFSVRGIPPQVGQKVYIQSKERRPESEVRPSRKYDKQFEWVVESVSVSCRVTADPNSITFAQAVRGVPENTQDYEVKLRLPKEGE